MNTNQQIYCQNDDIFLSCFYLLRSNQLSNGIKVGSLDWNSIALGAIGSGFLNMFSASLAGFGGPDLSWGINFILSLQLNVIPSGYDSIINLIKHYLQNKAN